MTDLERLERLLQAKYPCVWVVTQEEEYALGLVRAAAMNSGGELWIWSVIGGVREGLLADNQPLPETEHPAAALYHASTRITRPGSILLMLDLCGHLKDERTLRLCRDVVAQFRDRGCHLALIDHRDELPSVLAGQAASLTISLPDENELDTIIRDTLRRLNRTQRIEVEISRKHLAVIIRNLRGLSRRQVEQIITDVVADDHRFDSEDINRVLALKRQVLHRGSLLEYVEAPVDLEQIGGLGRLKSWLTHRASALGDAATKFGLTAPRGVLLLGVQGAGKSLCAKAVATAWQRPLLRMDVGALYDKYVGESERRLRDALEQAAGMAPVVLWIDEIEKAFASAASRSTDGGLSQRMFGTLLTWMQEHIAPVFLVATANDIEALPPELLRKGRFDEIFFVDLPGREARKQILAIHLRKRQRAPAGFDLDRLADACEGFSGAEIEQAILAAMHEAFAAGVELSNEQVLTAFRESPPLSVTMAESIAQLRDWAAGRCVPAE